MSDCERGRDRACGACWLSTQQPHVPPSLRPGNPVAAQPPPVPSADSSATAAATTSDGSAATPASASASASAALPRSALPRPADLSLLAPLRWASLGARYDWTAREYLDAGPSAPALPAALAQITTRVLAPLTAAGLVPASAPEAALVNFYPLGGAMGAHVDDAEPAVRRPIVSASLGASAVFLVGAATRALAPLALALHSGDVIVQAGPARRAFHAVPRVLERSSPLRALHAAARALVEARARQQVQSKGSENDTQVTASGDGQRQERDAVENEFCALMDACAETRLRYALS